MKNVLFISPDTFGYYKKISEELKKKGISVFWRNQIFFTSPIARILYRKISIFSKIFEKLMLNYILNGILSERIDCVFVIKGEGITKNVVDGIREKFPNALFVYYTWDSLENTPSFYKIYNQFDKVFTFDSIDAKRISNLELLPLFYSSKPTEKTIDFYGAFFVGTVHSSRISVVRKIAEEIELICKKPNFIYFYSPSKLFFFLQSLFQFNLKYFFNGVVNFLPLPYPSYMDGLSKSSVVIDICHKNQNGLTMRTMETLASGRKLITNNINIKYYNFYSKKNIFCIFDGYSIDDLRIFLNTPAEGIIGFDRYNLDYWLDIVLDLKNNFEHASI